ncbi:nucleotidyl transferase AbiEii/AbiGii toxin family protein [Thermodesulfobacteriota bacterium]
MKNEIDIIKDISAKFERLRIPYMLTGSVAMNYYAMPRMTRDIDVVVVTAGKDLPALVSAFDEEYYVSEGAVKEAIRSESMFNLIHLGSVIKVDCIVRKSAEFRRVEFDRRKKITLEDFSTYIVSREDLILSKLAWARESHSEMQMRDVSNLLQSGCDEQYLESWAETLGVGDLLSEARNA